MEVYTRERCLKAVSLIAAKCGYDAMEANETERAEIAFDAVMSALSSSMHNEIGYATSGDCMAICHKEGDHLMLYVCTINESSYR